MNRLNRLWRDVGAQRKRNPKTQGNGADAGYADNVFIERLWRTVKYEDIYLREYADGHELHAGLARYFHFYNYERPHSALENKTPASYYQPNGE